MKTPSVRKLVTAALFAALTCVATLVIQIRIAPTGGYINIGDCIVLIAAWTLSPFYGAAAAGIGSMLADLIAGAALYAPATFVIKACMALFGGMVFRTISKHPSQKMFFGCLCSALTAEAIMVFGYCGFEWFLLGLGPAALAGMPGNLIQAACGCISSIAVYLLMRRNTTLCHTLDHLH